jgi:hypothetical protein
MKVMIGVKPVKNTANGYMKLRIAPGGMKRRDKMQVETNVECRWQKWLQANRPGWSLKDRFSGKGVEVSVTEYNREYDAFVKRLREEETP